MQEISRDSRNFPARKYYHFTVEVFPYHLDLKLRRSSTPKFANCLTPKFAKFSCREIFLLYSILRSTSPGESIGKRWKWVDLIPMCPHTDPQWKKVRKLLIPSLTQRPRHSLWIVYNFESRYGIAFSISVKLPVLQVCLFNHLSTHLLLFGTTTLFWSCC